MTNNFKSFVSLLESLPSRGVILEDFSWAKEIGKLLPSLDLGLPTVEKRGKIEMVLDKKNPIFVQLSDGSKLFFTLDEFRRIEGGKPEKGKVMVVSMQRLGGDCSDVPSQITKCCVI